jgi:endonuclease YncB( thermonuclease family)
MRPMRWSRRRTARNPLGAVATLAVIALVAAVAALFVPPSSTLAGRAEALDGDTLRIGGARIRLLGLDAVELDQQCRRAGVEWACGRDARSYVADLLQTAETSCTSDGRDQYRRVLARCRVNDRDLGDAIVSAGWATADIEYGLPLAEARLHGRGIWSGEFDDPADWRRSHGESGTSIWEWLRGLLGY